MTEATGAPTAPVKSKLMVCRRCGSIHVKRDAWAAWSVELQQWELADVFDHAICDGGCDGNETRIIEIECDPGKAADYLAYVDQLAIDDDSEKPVPFGDWVAAQLSQGS